MKLAHILTPQSATLSHKGTTKTFMVGSPEYDQVKKFIKEDNEPGLINLLTSFKKSVEDTYNGKFHVVDDVVFLKNKDGSEDSLPRVLGQRLVEFAKEGIPCSPLLNFAQRLLRNPSYTAVQRLFECLEVNHHAVANDGRFLAYKRVRNDFKDWRTGKFDNSPGKIVEMKRNQVDESPDATCSYGLHCSSHEYASSVYQNGQGVLIEVLVDPADLVALPRDYNSQKFRVCKYEVVQVCKEETKTQVYHPPGTEDNNENVCTECNEDLDYCGCAGTEEDFDDDEDNCCDDCGDSLDHCDCDDYCSNCSSLYEECECDTDDI